MGNQTVRRGTPEDRAVIDTAVLATIERLAADGEAVGATQLAYEMATKFRRADIERSLSRLSEAKKIIYFERLRGWFPIRFEQRALDAIAKIDARDQKRNWTERKTVRHVITK